VDRILCARIYATQTDFSKACCLVKNVTLRPRRVSRTGFGIGMNFVYWPWAWTKVLSSLIFVLTLSSICRFRCRLSVALPASLQSTCHWTMRVEKRHSKWLKNYRYLCFSGAECPIFARAFISKWLFCITVYQWRYM